MSISRRRLRRARRTGRDGEATGASLLAAEILPSHARAFPPHGVQVRSVAVAAAARLASAPPVLGTDRVVRGDAEQQAALTGQRPVSAWTLLRPGHTVVLHKTARAASVLCNSVLAYAARLVAAGATRRSRGGAAP